MKIKVISSKELEALYNSMTNKELCMFLNISKGTLIQYIKENNIPMKGKGNIKKITITKN